MKSCRIHITGASLARADWVLSGSLEGWGDAIIPCFDLVVFLITPKGFGCDACAPARHGISAPMRWLPAAVEIARPKNSSNGLRITTMATARDAVWQSVKHGLRHCPARLCGSMDRGHCPNWSLKFAGRLPAE